MSNLASLKHSNTDHESPPENLDAFLSAKSLAPLWDCSRTTVSRLLDAAGVPAYYFGRGRNGSKRYRKVDIDRYLQNLDSA